MSIQYDQYLMQHKSNVYDGYLWIEGHCTAEEIDKIFPEIRKDSLMIQLKCHDGSKTCADEYGAYDGYFYGNAKNTAEGRNAFNRAWLLHIHRNPHHWQYWVLVHDEAENGQKLEALDIPDNYLIEMICDWWSFSFKKGDLYEIFKWYDEHKADILLSEKSRKQVESMLELIHEKLDKIESEAESYDEYDI